MFTLQMLWFDEILSRDADKLNPTTLSWMVKFLFWIYLDSDSDGLLVSTMLDVFKFFLNETLGIWKGRGRHCYGFHGKFPVS
jgi:hypothetical protein